LQHLMEFAELFSYPGQNVPRVLFEGRVGLQQLES